MPSTYRPRITREMRDIVLDVGETLNGGEPDTYQDALNLLVRYFGVLQRQIDCPECGETSIEEVANGSYHCWRCEEDRESGYFNVWDVIDPGNREQAALPALPGDVHLRFECNHEEHTSGSKERESTSNPQNQASTRRDNSPNGWKDEF